MHWSMRLRGWIIGGVALATAIVASVGSAQPRGRTAPRVTVGQPVVVELFTAQGCAGCPEANRVVEAASSEPGVIALTYAVDYWDYLGWQDTFARPEFTQRQQSYRQALRLRSVETPQVVVDGRRPVAGNRPPELQAAIDAEATRRTAPPEIEFRQTGDRVGVGSGSVPAGGAEVWAVVYQPGLQEVTVQGGDNRGQVVRHVNVVKRLRRLGDWSGRPMLYSLPTQLDADDAVAVLVQAKADRRILTAATN